MKKVFQRLVAMALAVVMLSGDAVAAAETLATLMLPASLKVIEEEAFMGTSVDQIVIPQGTEEIGERAFADGSIGEIIVPESVKYIADNAFENTTLQAFTAEEDTYAYAWGISNGFIKEDEDLLVPVITSCVLENGTGIHLEWQGHEEASHHYRLDYSTKEFGDGTHSYTFVYDTQYTIYGLKPNTTYYLRLTGIDDEYSHLHTTKTFTITTSTAVQNIPVTGLNYAGETDYVYFGFTNIGEDDVYARNDVEVEPYNASNQQLKWISSDPTIASVEEDTGVITGRSYGTVELTVTAADGSGASLNGYYRVLPRYPEGFEAVVDGTSIHVSWDAAPEADCYDLACYDVETSEIVKELLDYKELNYIFTGLKPNHEYQITLQSGVYMDDGSVFYGVTDWYDPVATREKSEPVPEEVFTVVQTTDNYAKITGYSGREAELVIPEQIGDWIIAEIGDSAFENAGFLTSVSLPDTVTTIGENAFSGCSELINAKLPSKLVTIKAGAFSGTKLNMLVVPEGTREIQSKAFADCSLVEIALPASLETMAADTFDGSYPVLVVYEDSYAQKWTEENSYVKWIWYGETYEGDYLYELLDDGTAEIIYYWGQDEEVTIPSEIAGTTVSSIGYCAFYDQSIKNVIIPEGIKTIGEAAFLYCEEMESVLLPNTLEYIGQFAFQFCSSLTSVVVPESVNIIDAYAFSKCFALESIMLPQTMSFIGENAFWDDSVLNNVILPIGLTSIEESLFGDCVSLSSITVPEGVVTLGLGAFIRCMSLESVELPESLETISERAFEDCTSLMSLVIPEKVSSIADDAFGGCNDPLFYVYEGSYAEGWCHNNNFRADYVEVIPPAEDEVSQFKYLIKNNEAEIVGYLGNSSDVVIPSLIENCPVTSIGNSAFRNRDNLTSIIISDSVTFIGQYAFSGCKSLTSLSLPDGLQTIDMFAFENCSSLTTLFIPDSVTAINSLYASTFSGCDSLTIYCNVGTTAAEQVCAVMGRFSVMGYPDIYLYQHKENDEYYLEITGCVEGKTDIVVPALVDGIPLTHIGEKAFQNRSDLTSVTLSEGLKSIGMFSFENCSSLTTLFIPNSVTAINSLYASTFSGCDNLQLSVYEGSYAEEWCLANNYRYDYVMSTEDASKFEYSIRNNKVEITGYLGDKAEVVIPNTIENYPVTLIGYGAFEAADFLKSIKLPDTVTAISERAFYNCCSLASITIPDSLTTIGSYAFYGCSSLVSIVIPNGVTYINKYVFYGCSNLTSITIPDSVNYIMEYAFHGCSRLNNIFIPDGVTHIQSYAFSNSGITDITLPPSMNFIQQAAFKECSNLINITIPETVTGIGYNAFDGCSSLASIIIPDSVRTIQSYAFKNCSSLTRVTIPNSMISLPRGIFKNCNSLISIDLPDSLASIGEEAFLDCTQLTSIIIPAGVASIGWDTFNGCSSLASITLPDSLVSIGDYAFMYCSSLTEMILPKKLESMGVGVFSWCEDILFVVHEGSYAEEWCLEKNYRYDYVSSETEEEIIPYITDYKINSTAIELTVKEGDNLTLSGIVYGGNDNLNNLQVSILCADNQGLGVAFDRAENINAASYDLSAFDPIVVGQEYEDANQKITMQAGYSYLIMLHASDVNGVGFGDLDPTVEGPQGPSIKVTVIEDSDYRFAVSGGAENGLTASHWGGMGMNVTVASVGKWTVESDSEWMTTNVSSGESGDSFYAIIEQNKEYENRYGYLTLSCDGFNPISIKVTQNGIPRRVELKIFQPDPKRITQDSAWVCGQLIWGENETASNYCLAGIQYGIVGEPWEDSVFIDPSMDDDTALDPKTGKYWLQIGGLTSGALYRFRSVAQRADGTWLPESDEVTVRITDYCEHQYSQMYYAYADEVKAHREAYIAEGNSFLPEIFLHEDETLTTHAIRFPYIQLCDLCENYNVTYTTAAETSQEHTWIVENTIRYDNISKTTHDAYPYLITRCNSTVGNDECGYVFSEDAGVPSLEEAHVYVDGVCACGYCNVVWEGSINDNKLQIDVQVVKGQPDANKTYLFIAENDAGSHYTYSIPKGTTSAAITFRSDLGLPRAQHYTFYILPEDVMLDENNQEEYRLFDAVVPLYAGNMITSISSGSNQNSNNELLIGEDVIIHWDGSFGVNSTTVVAKANDNVVYSKTFDHDGPGIIIIPYENIAPYVSAAVSGVISRVVDKMEVVVTVNPPALSGLAPISSTWTGYFVQKPEGKYSIYLSWNGIPETECTFDGTTNIGINVTDQYYPLAVVSGNSDYFGLRAYLDGKPLTLTDPNSEYEWVFAGTGTDLAGTEGTTDIAYQYPRYYTEGGFELGEKTWIIKDFNDGFTFQYNKNMIGLKHSIELRIKGSEERLAWFTPIVYDKQVFTVYGKDVGYGKNDAAYSGRVDLPISQSTFWESASLEQKRLLFDLNYKRMLIESMIPSYTVEEFLNACGEERAFDLKTGFVQLMLNIGTVVTGTLGDIAEYIVDLGKLVIWDIGLLVSGGPTMDTLDRSIELSENVLDSFGEDNTIRKMITHDSGFVDAIVESLVQTARVEQQKSNPNRMADTQAEMVYRFFDGLFSSGNEKSIEVIKECLNLVFEQNIDNVNWDACGDIFVGYRDGSSVNLKFNEVFRLDILEDLTSLEQTLFYEMLDPEANRSVNRFKDPQYKFFWDSFGEEWQDVAYEALPQTSPIRSQININRLYKEVEKWLDLGDCLFAGYDAYRMADMYDKALAQLKENMPSLIQQYSDTHNKDMSAYDAAWLDSLLEELTISTSNQMEKVLTAIVTKAVEQGIEEISSQMLKEVCEEVIEEIAKKIGKDGVGKVAAVASRAAGYVTAVWYGIDIALFLSDAESTVGRIPTFKELYKMYQDTQVDLREAISRYVESPSEDNFNAVKQLVYIYNITKGSCITTQYSVYIKDQQSIRARFSNFTSWYRNTRNNLFDAIFTGDWKKYVEELQTDIRKSRIASYEEAMAGELMQMKELINVMFPQIP